MEAPFACTQNLYITCNMEKARIKVNPNKVLFSVWFLWCFSLVPLLLPFIFGITENDSLVVIICFLILVSLGSIFLFINALYMVQYAEVSDHGITIRSLLSTIKEIKWDELIDLRTESVATFSSAYGHRSSEDWIVLYTDPSQKEKEKHPFNRKKRGPWYIDGTSRNISVLADYAKKYAPHIYIDPDLLF